MFVFIDESGFFDIGPKTTRYVVMAYLRVKDRLALSRLTKMLRRAYRSKAKPKKLRTASEIKASQANPELLEYIYRKIARSDVSIGYVVLDKRWKAFGKMDKHELYVHAGSALAALLYAELSVERVHPSDSRFFVDRFVKGRSRDHFETILTRPPFGLFSQVRITADFVDSTAHKGVQLADYCAYAIFQKVERGNERWYQQIMEKLEPSQGPEVQ